MKNEQPTNPFHSQHDITGADIEGAKSVLRNLCALASAAIGVSRDRLTGCQSIDELEKRIQIMEYLADRTGWVADVALRKLGDRGMLAGAEDWMLPET